LAFARRQPAFLFGGVNRRNRGSSTAVTVRTQNPELIMASRATNAREAKRTSQQQRAIQRKIDKTDKRAKPKDKRAMQAGARRYPEPPLPKQHQPKPGHESDLSPQPMFDAPFYKGSEKLKNMTAIITGGDSGIGRSVAVLFAREGADIVIVYLDEHDDAELTKAAVEKEGRKCLLISGDVADREFCNDAIEQTVQKFGRLDVLVNNAAFQLHVTRFEDLTEEHFDRTLKTNLYGYFHMAQAAVPHMKKGSAILNTGSITGIMGNKDLLDYSMTKGGIHAFTCNASHRPGDSRECDCAGSGLDTAESGGQEGRGRFRIRRPHPDEASGAA
jgi:NADP-dependent 3-hydroxy acid dehydrogenase YdfG